MKKVLSVLLSASLILLLFAFPVNATETGRRYYDKFADQYCEGKDPEKEWEWSGGFCYDELYYHNSDGNVDWALVKAEFGERSEVIMQNIFFGRAIAANDCAYPFEYLYGIYDVSQERFFDLKEIQDESRYPDLQEVFDEFGIGQRITAPQYGDELLFKDEFLNCQEVRNYVQYFGEENVIRCYDELYIHDTDGIVDWALVYGDTNLKLPYGSTYSTVGDKVFRTDGILQPFGNGYAVYQVSTGNFFWLQTGIERWRKSYKPDAPLLFPDLAEVIEELPIGERIGDVNSDSQLTITDATEIQRCLAEFCDYPESDGVEAAGCVNRGDSSDPVWYISDVNRDGKRSIRDVTEIQRILAEIV